MKPKVVVYRRVPQSVIDYLSRESEVVYFEEFNEQTFPQLLEALATADGFMGSGLKVDKEVLDRAPRLKIVSNVSVGYDNLDLKELRRRSILATNTPGVLDDSTADTVFGLMLAAARRISEMDRYVKDGAWDKTIGEQLFGVDVHHKTLGIVGMGNIGRAIAKRARFGFDMEILYHNRSRNAEIEAAFDATYCELNVLLEKSDFVCLMVPSTPETAKMIGEKEFRLMKRTAIFVNGSRGQNVDEQALARALQEKWILGAGLDVYETEPIEPSHPLLQLPNVVTTPHIGSATVETRHKMAMLAAENVLQGVKGLLPPNVIM